MLSGLLFVIGVAALICGLVCFVLSCKDIDTDYTVSVAVSLVIGAVLVAWSCIAIVDYGQAGVPVIFGHVAPPISSGFHIVFPFTDVERITTKTQQYTMSHVSGEGQQQGDDSVTAKSQDNAGLGIEVSVQYHVDPSQAGRLLRTIGTDYDSKIIRPNVRGVVINAAANYQAVDITSKLRATYEADVQRESSALLATSGLIVERVNVRQIEYLDDGFRQAIAAKLAAQQSAAAQQFALQAAQQKAQIARVEAQGLADSQSIIHKTLTPLYLQYLYVKSLQAVAEGHNNSTVILPFDQRLTPMINIKGADK